MSNAYMRFLARQNGDASTRFTVPPLRSLGWVFLLLSIFSGAAGAATPGSNRMDAAPHWAFQPVRHPAVPNLGTPRPTRNPVDAFLGAEQEKRGLVPLETAAPHILLRRLYLDLIGVPPSPAELQEFIADPSEAAYAQVVERLLASPHYGERWGRHWMDVWRYSDWAGHGAEVRESQPHIWRWRDWIIESLNEDKPYDRMILEMLAADELAPLDRGALRATGFLARNWFRYNRNVWLEDTVEHTGKAFLGLTLNCAKCHDHKYDPIDQVEFYRMRAFFEPYEVRADLLTSRGDSNANSVVRAFDARPTEATYVFTRGNEARPETNQVILPQLPRFLGAQLPPVLPMALPVESYYPALSPSAVSERLASADAEVLAMKRKLTAAQAAVRGATNQAEALQAAQWLATRKLALAEAQRESLRQRITAEQRRLGMSTGEPYPAARAAAAAERRVAVATAECALAEAEEQVRVQRTRQEPPDPKTKQALAEAEKKTAAARETLAKARQAALEPSTVYEPLGTIHPQWSTGRRLALARWIASRQNPLTARVAMNHLWMRHMGTPLVPTVFEFGKAGKPPTHPDLLDWLAGEFMRQGWSMKAMHRLVVTSAAYRMRSSGGANTVVAQNEAKDRDNVYLWRMNVRRAEAEVVRDSVLRVGGSLDWTMKGPEQEQGAGEKSARRSVYFRHAKEKVMEFTRTFDGPGVTECYRRDESIVPQQALAMANSTLVKTQSRRLARSISAALGRDADDVQFINAAFTGVLSRAPTPEETGACREFLERQTTLLAHPTGLTAATVGEASSLPAAAEPRARAKENLVLVLMNHNDFVSIR